MTDDLKKVVDGIKSFNSSKYKIEFDPTLVRGMGYYTGMIYEIKYKDYPGSVGGGGRYDKMIGKRIGQDVPACGFSIGFERIVDIMLEEEQENNEKKLKLAVVFNSEHNDVNILYSRAKDFRNGIVPLTIKERNGKKVAKKEVSVLKREKKFGKQLKKLLEQGFTHYATLEDNEVLVIKELEINEN
jgi:histidyl-tRNA synthetase